MESIFFLSVIVSCEQQEEQDDEKQNTAIVFKNTSHSNPPFIL
jgi:hypothetical protein